MTPLLAVLLCLPTAEPPAALVLRVKGSVEVQPAKGDPRPAKPGKTLVYVGDRLVVLKDGEAVLAFKAGGAIERVKPGTEATVGANGCTPPSAVERRQSNAGAVSAALRDIRPSSADGRTAAATLRSGGEGCPGVTPISGSTVASERPSFAWPVAKEVKTYVVIVSTGLRDNGVGRELWRAETTETRLAFPADKPALRRGFPFQWKVTDLDSRELACGDFVVATGKQKERLDALAALAQSEHSDDVLLAAEGLDRLGAWVDALAAYDRLVKLVPNEASHREELDALRRRVSR
jgi:hypothetical protein